MGTMKILTIILLGVQLFPCLFINPALSSPSMNPITCSADNKNCEITNYLGAFPDRSICKAAEVAYPATEQEVIDLVAKASQRKQKMKVVTRHSHSVPKLACSDGNDGLLISSSQLNKLVKIDKAARTMTVEGGMLLKDLIAEAAKAGLALPNAPNWWGLTIAGLLSTGAHGSSLWGKGGVVHEYVIGLRIISPGEPQDGYVKVRTLCLADEEDLDAAKLSLGVLGVISQVTLQLEPIFKRSISYKQKGDDDLGEQAMKFGMQYEFADITWYPSHKVVMYRIDHRVPSRTQGNGLYDIAELRPSSSATIAANARQLQTQEETDDVDGRCRSAELLLTSPAVPAFGLTNNGLNFTGFPVVGYNNRLQSSGTCLDTTMNDSYCSWDPRVPGIFYHITAFSIALPKLKSFIEEVQKLVSMRPKSMCGVEQFIGVTMRYVKRSNVYLGQQEDSVFFDIQYYRSKNPLTPRIYEDILEEIEQMAFFKYIGLPHWGKNRNLVYDGIIYRFKNARKFLEIKEKFDPLGLFSSQWSDQILGLQGGVNIIKEGCALEGLCICFEDMHCAPKKGYYCRFGKVYKEARVCEKIET